MSSGGGKGGKKETETTIPDWVRGPAERNLRRAEQVQQLKYMPYTGPQVAAFNETQNAAMNNNISAAKAFGLLDPNSTLTATSGMPAPTEYAGGFKGYGSIDIYDQALKELTARDPANMAAYNNLFGNAVPALLARGGGGGGGGGGASPGSPSRPSDWNPTMGVSQAVYEAKMNDIYANTRVGTDASGKPIYGYTGQDERATGGVNMSRAGIRSGTTPMKVTGPNYQEALTPKKDGGTAKNYLFGNRITGGR